MLFDKTDRKILNILQNDGRITNAKLAESIGISPPAMLERVRRLEKAGLITRYSAIVDREKTGYELLAIITVSLGLHQLKSLDSFKNQISKLDEVLECYQVSGEYDFILKVVLHNIRAYRNFVNEKLAGIEGIQNIKSSFVLDDVKTETKLYFETETGK
ncbi:MAG: Lrp/AsnC family transcriptional regulator [Desulfobacterales bacterium]|nr:Lrp/AsnC family transcriptional regulator [Desulfobacterales bacterium]MCP4162879.1 Lrp/AsnC family transcriptional regulator [Deltaproteobacteria bacterium]